MDNEMNKTSWQERYKATSVYTLRCRLNDAPGALGAVISAIGSAQANIGNIDTAGIDGSSKIRDVQVYCSDLSHLQKIQDAISRAKAAEVISVRDDVMEIHRRGAIDIVSRTPIRTLTDLRMIYTPGVAAVCNKIVEDPQAAWEYTGICDRVAIVTNGTAVLGLGDIGPLAGLPVMEGKAAIFAEFAQISAVPVLIDSKDVREIVEIVAKTASCYGAIQLEDISSPQCFEIEEQLKQRLNIPVMHDDQHGTATVLLAALINALKKTNRKAADCKVIILGAGAAGYAISMMLLDFGMKDIVVYDSYGAIYEGRAEKMNPYKHKLAAVTNRQKIKGDLMEGFKGRDIFIGVSRPKMVGEKMISAMAKDSLVFPLSNPVGEISVQEAYAAGAAVAADGRGINNALAYPGLFRGALDVRARDITRAMQVAAAKKLAELAPDDMLLPDMLDRNIHKQVAQAVAQAYKK